MKSILLLVGVMITAAVVLTLYLPHASPTLGNVPTGTTGTYSSSSVSSTVALVLDVNPSARYRALTNKTAVVTWIVCSPTSTGVVAGVGQPLIASTTLSLVEENGTMWCTDKIWGITSAGTSSIATMER